MHEGADVWGTGIGERWEDEQPLPCPFPASVLPAPATPDSSTLYVVLSLGYEHLSTAFFSSSLVHTRHPLSYLFFSLVKLLMCQKYK